MKRPLGYFVHHQGRGHAVRCAAIVNALPGDREVKIFCAREDIFPSLPDFARIVRIPSLFERSDGDASGMDHLETPQTVHCAPLGWPGIRRAMATVTGWFDAADPALMISDVSAEVAQLSRICSVPHVCVLQHGDRSDPAHMAAYDGAAGLLAPFHRDLAQPEWPDRTLKKTCFAGGLGSELSVPERSQARRRIGVDDAARLVLVIAGAGFGTAPIGVGARTSPDTRWLVIGKAERDWHATEPANVEHRGWVENPMDYIAAADLVVSATGNTTCQQVLGAARPWLAIPEWRYFDEQHRKAQALAAVGAATVRPHPPSSAGDWQDAISETFERHAPSAQLALSESDPAGKAARWLDGLAAALWREPAATSEGTSLVA